MTKNKAAIAAQARSLGLSDQGTKAQIQGRIDAWEQASHDTANAVYVDGSDLGPVASGNAPATGKLPVHPVNAALIGGAIGAAWHLLGGL